MKRANADTRRAAKLYEDFRESAPRIAREVHITLPRAVAIMGYCEFIGYSTTHRGASRLYKHDFAEGSRPLLCAGPRQNQLYLIGGRFHVTERGIVDLSPAGVEIDDGGGHRRRR
jgi:hypothetical protein